MEREVGEVLTSPVYMATRNGIYYNFKLSPYKFKIENVRLIFSSSLHMKKFKEQYLRNREIVNSKLSIKYQMEIEFN